MPGKYFSGIFVLKYKDMNTLQIVDNAIAVKRAFGSFKILDDFEVYDLPAVIEFAKIVSNYLAMQEKINEIEN
jgi:hypothetical protein